MEVGGRLTKFRLDRLRMTGRTTSAGLADVGIPVLVVGVTGDQGPRIEVEEEKGGKRRAPRHIVHSGGERRGHKS